MWSGRWKSSARASQAVRSIKFLLDKCSSSEVQRSELARVLHLYSTLTTVASSTVRNAACRSLQSLDNFHSLSKHSAGDGSKNGYEGRENLSSVCIDSKIAYSLDRLQIYFARKEKLLASVDKA